jgi:predicted TIM-barrel fold metal-dependent hydrolase
VGSLEEHEVRLSALERQVAEVRQDAAAARVLAGAADRDVSEFRQTLNAHTRSLNALRETQIEHQAETRAFQAETRDGFAKVNAGMVQITGLVQTMIDRDAT